ncbi:MAG: citramalate synthase, partial [Rectinemataceae bacterium]
MDCIEILDSTLRDGAQGEGISFSVADKLEVVRTLDGLGVDIIEAGNPASNPKDLDFFAEVKALKLVNSRLAAFGSTRRKGERASEDPGLKSLLSADTGTVVIFGKSWDFHATRILGATLDENLLMIEESIAFMKASGRRVIYDAEHFFDGYTANPEYAIRSVAAAARGGAECLVLCDTNGGT